MTLLHRYVSAVAIMAAVTWLEPQFAMAAAVVTAEKAAEVVVARNVTVKDGEVTGELVNKSSHPVRDVQLLIRHTWHWKNEFRPGKDELGMAVYYTEEKEISPGGSVPFNYKPASSLPSRPDGSFETTVSVAGFAEVFR